MKPREALDHIKQRIQVNTASIEETHEALHVIQNLVDKSTQQKPVIIGSPADYNERCPNCNERVDIFADSRFCQKCGQALDWSDINGE
ncbi:MAG: zinc ribbon domain-containing protein [Ruminococcus sp.]|nr:zinc ribbon domain-containing protein [Ruminococcus sp.]